MKVEAAVITVKVSIDLDDITPDLDVDICIVPEFSFLETNRAIIAGWLRGVADNVEASGGETLIRDE